MTLDELYDAEEVDRAGYARGVELASGARSIEDILIDLAQIESEWAGLRALHGPSGKFDNLRKALLSVIALRIRAGDPPAGVLKWTDDVLDKAAHADAEYRAFIDGGVTDATRYNVLDAKREAYLMEYNRGQSVLRLAAGRREVGA